MRFDNAQHCISAGRAFKRQGKLPPKHARPEVNMILSRDDRKESGEKPPVKLVQASKPELRRDPRIKVFSQPVEMPSEVTEPVEQKQFKGEES